MARQMHATVDDDIFRQMKVLAAENDANISGLLRALFAVFVSDKELQEKVAQGIEPERRGGRRERPISR